jgi:nicotinamide mononucleotide transporter
VVTKGLNYLHLGLVALFAILAAALVKHVYHDDWLGFGVFVTGVIGVYLVAVEHISNWPVGLINVSIWGWICFSGRLYADMSLQLFFFILGIQGWYLWAKGGTGKTELQISRVTFRGWLLILLLFIAGISIYVPVISRFKADWIWVDSILTVTSIIAQVLINLKKIENWLLWIIVNAAYIPVYKAKGYYSLVYLSAILLILAVVGLLRWLRTFRTEQTLTVA